MSKKSPALNEGDIVAIPRQRGGYYVVLHLASNRFGEAFGLFDGHIDEPQITSAWLPIPISIHVYTGKNSVRNGRWSRIGCREELRSLFAKKPEIYHAKSDNPSNTAIGPFGSAETADGDLRQLSESESRGIGLPQGRYRQIMLEEQFEQFLERTIG